MSNATYATFKANNFTSVKAVVVSADDMKKVMMSYIDDCLSEGLRDALIHIKSVFVSGKLKALIPTPDLNKNDVMYLKLLGYTVKLKGIITKYYEVTVI
jgi:hypothetical protein